MKFTWNETKCHENIVKHGLDFADVPEMFDGPMLVQLDTRYNYGEDRWIGMGWIRCLVAVVVYVERDNQDTIRIISARKATRYERHCFQNRIPHGLEPPPGDV